MFYFFCLVALVYGSNPGSLQPIIQANHRTVKNIKPVVNKTATKVIKLTINDIVAKIIKPVHKISFLESAVTGKSFLESDIVRKSFLSQVLIDPKKFVTEVQFLDPSSLRQIITLLHELLDTSVDRENELNNAVTSAKAAVRDAINVLADAEDALTKRNTAVNDAHDALEKTKELAATQISEAKNIVTVKKQVEFDAKSNLNNKMADHASKLDAKEHAEKMRDGELGDLNHEQEIIKRVIEMLHGLHDDATDCPEICTEDYTPVCGTDGNTYSNGCDLKQTTCSSGNDDLIMDYEGECHDHYDYYDNEHEG